MSSPTKNRHGVYVCRVGVPEDVRGQLGKRELKESLRTKDPRQARLRFSPVYSRFMQTIENARRQLRGEPILRAREIEALADEWLFRKVESVEQSGQFRDWYYWETVETDAGIPARSPESPIQASLAEAEKRGPDELHSVIDQVLGEDVQEVLEEVAPGLGPDSREYRILADRMAGRVKELVHHLSQREQGRYSMPKAPDYHPAPVGSSMLLSDAWEAYLDKLKREDGERKAQRRAEDYSASIQGFIRYKGDVPIATVSADDLRAYRDLLFTLPSRPNKALKLKSLEQQADEAARLGMKTLSFETVSNRMIHLSALFTAALDIPHSGLAENPVTSDMIPNRRKRRKAETRKDYSVSELARVFKGPWFSHAGHVPREKFGIAGIWVPLMVYYTGARREEITSLDVADIEEIDGVWCVRIRPNGDDKTTKTGTSRIVPLHSDLLELGLLEYAEGLPKAGKLWPSLVMSRNGYGGNLARRWSEYTRAQGLPEGVSPFHGLRHSFVSRLREQGADTSIISVLAGHSVKGQTNEYGSFSPQALKRVVDKLPSVPGLVTLKHTPGFLGGL